MSYRWIFFVLMNICFTATAQPSADSATRPASYRYGKPSFFRKLIFGKNYREVWRTPVTAPVLYLSQKGLTVTELGGGQQTKSLRLKDASGREWVLRSVEKSAEGLLIPQGVPKKLAMSIAQDMFSASFPYAPLVVYELTRATGITAPQPFLYYVGADKALGKYDSLFTGTLCFLEQREPTPDNSETINTFDLMETLEKDHRNGVLQKQVLTARLIDMLVADWDRHADQWRWGRKDSAGLQWYYSIPRDRDQAFFQSKGLLVKFGPRHFVGFDDDNLKLEKLNNKTWEFDHLFLNELNESDWKEAIITLQQQITDSVIYRAVQQLPYAVYKLSANEIAEKLKSRRQHLLKAGMDYYKFLARQVFINGSDKQERFAFRKEPDGLVLTITDSAGSRTYYQRKFDPSTTKSIVVNGLGGNDMFLSGKEVETAIRLTLNGGEGQDTYNLGKGIRVKIEEE